MQDSVNVGFEKESGDSKGAENEGDDDNEKDYSSSIPSQVQQYWVEVPTQYRLVYLLMFLYAHMDKKVIVFSSNCETVNLLTTLCK